MGEGVSSADLLHEVKHADAHTLAMRLLDLGLHFNISTRKNLQLNTQPPLAAQMFLVPLSGK